MSLRSRLGFAAILIAAISGIVLAITLNVSGETMDNLILSRLGYSEILKLLESSDHDKGFSEEQIAAKYILGEAPAVDVEVPARIVLKWKSFPPSEQRQLKVVWYREHYRQISMEELNKYVNVDYLKARAEKEYRENPLEVASDELKAAEKALEMDTPKPKGKSKTKAASRHGSKLQKNSSSDTSVSRTGRHKKTRTKRKQTPMRIPPKFRIRRP